MTIFYCLRFETPPTWRARSPYLYPQEEGGPVIPPGTGFPFRRLLLLAGLRWRYSNPPPRGATNQQLESELLYDRLFTSNQFVLAPSPEKISSIFACSLVARETTCPQSCSLVTAVVLSRVYTALSWQWICISENFYLFYVSRAIMGVGRGSKPAVCCHIHCLKQQELLGRTKCLRSFETTRTP
jgi:hypothetical protein